MLSENSKRILPVNLCQQQLLNNYLIKALHYPTAYGLTCVHVPKILLFVFCNDPVADLAIGQVLVIARLLLAVG